MAESRILSAGTCRLVALLCTAGFMLAGAPALAQVSGAADIWVHGVDIRDGQATIFLSALSVNNRAGQEPIMGYAPLSMNQNAFELFIDRQPVKAVQVSRFAESGAGLDALFAIDASGSVAANFNNVIDAVSSSISKLRPGKDQAAILEFGTTVNLSEFPVPGLLNRYSPFTDDQQALQAFIRAPLSEEIRKRTLLYRALDEAIRRVARGRFADSGLRVQKLLVLLTDGDEEDTGFDSSVPERTAMENRVNVFCVGVPEPAVDSKFHSNLRRIAANTGGVFVPMNDLPSAKAVFDRIDYLVKNEYVLTFALPPNANDGLQHALNIQAKYGPTTFSKAIQVLVPFRQAPPPPPWWQPLLPFVYAALGTLGLVIVARVVKRVMDVNRNAR